MSSVLDVVMEETKELQESFSIINHLQIDTLKNLLHICSSQKCKDCPVLATGKCEIGKQLPEYNPEQLCPVPILQAKSRVYGIEVIDENIIMAKLQEIFTIMRKWAENPRDCKYMMDCLMKIKEEYFPTMKKNLNINMDIDVKERFMKFYDEVKNEVENTNQGGRPQDAKQVFDSERQGHTKLQEQN